MYCVCAERQWELYPHQKAIYHLRRFKNDWQVQFFIPAARSECAIIRTVPALFQPGRSASGLEHFLVIESGNIGYIYPYIFCEA